MDGIVFSTIFTEHNEVKSEAIIGLKGIGSNWSGVHSLSQNFFLEFEYKANKNFSEI